MTNQKRKKNNFLYYLILILFTNIALLNANEIKCKKFDIKCKTNKFIEETKQYQKKGLEESKEQLNKTKKGVIFVNTSRAEIFNEKTILKGLSTGHIKHCAMDVFHEEPLPKNHQFLNSKYVTLTPHSAWVTSQAIDRLLWSGLKLLKIHSEEKK